MGGRKPARKPVQKRTAKPAPPLTPRARLFAERYAVHLTGAWAAREAGYAVKGAARTGMMLLRDPRIKALIEAAMDARSERTRIDQDWVVNALVDEATDRSKSAKHAARVAALELLGRHVKMFPNRLEFTGADGGPIKTQDVTPIEAARRIAFVLTLGAQAAPG
jgi:phage terminase small subunit